MFSMTNDWSSARPSWSPIVRPIRSRPPPGWAGTMILTGFAGYACARARAGNSARTGALSQVLLEEGNRAIPGELRRRLVETRRRFFVEAMLRARVRLDLVAHAGLLQLLLVGRIRLVDARILLGQVNEQRRLDLRHCGSLGPHAIVRCASLQIRPKRGRQEVGRAAAPAEAGGAQLLRGQRMLFDELGAVKHVGPQLGLVELRLQRAPVVVV